MSARGSAGLAVRALRKVTGSDTQETERSALGHVVQALGEMKGAAMKLGQALSMEVDALPPELRQIVARLQSEAPPIDSEEIAAIIEDELGAPPERLFAEFDPKPLAAASLGQVHAARLEDGREVVLKVQYPGIAEALDQPRLDRRMTILVARIEDEIATAEVGGELVEVAAHRLGGDAELLGERDDLYAAGRAGLPGDVLLPLLRVHRCS